MDNYLELSINDVLKLFFKVTTDSNVQWLQYRILHWTLPVKTYLKNKKKVDNDTCSFCNKEVETTEHVLTSCPTVVSLWNNLRLQIYSVVSKRVGFIFMNILLGEVPLSKSNQYIYFFNSLCETIFFPMYIYKKPPIFRGYYIIWALDMK